MEPISSVPFFIADRLRGIPLVSSGQKSKTSASITTTQEPNTTAEQEDRVLADLIGVSGRQNGKRAAINSGSGDERLGSLLKSTVLIPAASKSNRHVIIQRASKPMTTITTTTRRPQASSTTQRTRPRTGGGSSSNVNKPVPRTTTTTTTPTRPTTTKSSPTNTNQQSRARSLASNTQLTEPKNFKTSINSNQNQTNQNSQSNKAAAATTLKDAESKIVRTSVGDLSELSRTTQAAQATPVDLKGTTQSISSHYTNRPNAIVNPSFAGENWKLFNRPDGSFSVFEVLVILSNVMIVGTIVLVILFSWIKSSRRKRHLALHEEQAAMQPQETLTLNCSRSPSNHQQFDGSDRASKVSMISSGLSSNQAAGGVLPSALKNSTSNGQYGQMRQDAIDLQQQHQQITNNLQQHVEGVSARVSPAQRIISSEIKGAGGALANKAMAIVQPTEATSNVTIGSAHSDSEKLASALKEELAGQVGSQRGSSAISRSVSDLSSSAVKQKTITLNSASSEPDRVAALEKLFNNSGDGAAPTSSKTLGEQIASGESKLASNQRRMSASSLESIELPPTLVESIKRSDPKNPANVEAPSPNLLLGEVGGAVVGAARTAQGTLVAGIKGQLDQAAKTAANIASEITSKAVSALEAQQQKQQQPVPKSMERESSKKADSSANSPKLAQENVGSRKIATDTNTTANSNKKPPLNSDTTEREPRRAALAAAATTGSQKATATSVSSAVNKGSSVAANRGQRPVNPVGVEMDIKEQKQANNTGDGTAISKPTTSQKQDQSATATSNVKNHQVVVNKLDKRKTNLEIVDLRDDSVTGKMRNGVSIKDGNKASSKGGADEAGADLGGGPGDSSSGWISMDGVAVVQQQAAGQAKGGHQHHHQQQATPSNPATPALGPQSPVGVNSHPMSPSEIIESRFHVDYSSKRRQQQQHAANSGNKFESLDSKTEEYTLNNIENELEQDNKMRNRKYFVYIVHDGHFTAKKECIARIELPPKRRITLAELRQLIANSQDISLSSLRRNRFKFVTETYRLLNENEDAAILHQIYPTQGVFLKLNIPEQEAPSYLPYKSRSRLSSSSTNLAGIGGGSNSNLATNAMNAPSSVAQQTIASRRRATARPGRARPQIGGSGTGGGGEQSKSSKMMAADGDSSLPAIEVDEYAQFAGGSEKLTTTGAGRQQLQQKSASSYGRARASSVGRFNKQAVGGQASSRQAATTQQHPTRPAAFRRSKSSALARRSNQTNS